MVGYFRCVFVYVLFVVVWGGVSCSKGGEYNAKQFADYPMLLMGKWEARDGETFIFGDSNRFEHTPDSISGMRGSFSLGIKRARRGLLSPSPADTTVTHYSDGSIITIIARTVSPAVTDTNRNEGTYIVASDQLTVAVENVKVVYGIDTLTRGRMTLTEKETGAMKSFTKR